MADGKLLIFSELDSTNSYSKREISSLPDGSSVIAERQTAGRGRLGRTFESGDGGLYLSYIMKPDYMPPALLSVTGMAAVAARRAIFAVCGVHADIKWMNDLLLCGKKICGILTEAGSAGEKLGYIIVGIGINVNTPEGSFPEELAGKAGLICSVTNKMTDIVRLRSALLDELKLMHKALLSGETADYLAEYKASCVTVGQNVTVTYGGESVSAEAVGIDDDFSLILKQADGSEITVRTGEATLSGSYMTNR